jgi:MFS family permease
MKIDLVGPKQRGLAMGLNEFAGYLAVAVSALATGWLAEAYGLRPEPFYMGIAFAAAGIGLSLLFVRETHHHAALEAVGFESPAALAGAGGGGAHLGTREIFARASWRDPALSSASHAGMVNNLNDGLAWGLFPLFFAAGGLSVGQIGVLSFLYPAVWGLLQLWTGALSDRWGRKRLIAGGMMLQGIALAAVASGGSFAEWAAAAVTLGVGTAMVYPTLLASIGDVAHPRWRGSAVGVYRLWRDGGYAIGALLSGVLADALGMAWAIGAIAGVTALSGLVTAFVMYETHPARRQHLPASSAVLRVTRIES